MSGRVIMHVDMNAFFASVEQQSNPELRGKPIAVVGRGRTVVTTASYEARAYGVKTGMNKYEALKKCPKIIFVTGNNRKYTWTSSSIVKMMLNYTPLVEVFSIDEAFLDLTGSVRLFGSAERIAYLLKARILHEFGIRCSIGIAPNKLLAKLASDMKKPDGLTIISQEQVENVLDNLPIEEICGIGRKMKKHLNMMGIFTCGQLTRFPVAILKKKFGIIGERLVDMAAGIDESPVVPQEDEPDVKSVGHSMTFPEDTSSRKVIKSYLLQLAEMVGRRARRYGVSGKTVHLVIRYSDFSTYGKQLSMASHISLSMDIYNAAVGIFDSFPLELPVRMIGVRITNLIHNSRQIPLFRKDRIRARMTYAMDEINSKYGDFKVCFGSMIDFDDKGSRVISPSWRPDGIKNIDVG